VGLGLIAVAGGTAWAIGGIGSAATSARRLAELLPLLFVLGGALAILLLVVPRGALAGPVSLIAIGLLGLAAEDGLLRNLYVARIPAFVLVGAGVLIAMSRSERIQVGTGVERFGAFLFPVHRQISGKAPGKIIVRTVFGSLKLDLSEAERSLQAKSRIWIDVTCLVGRIEIIVPNNWEVKAGRIELARHINFEGTLTSVDIASQTEEEDPRDRNLAVINVLGWWGAVLVQQA
jgi:hypothetical protein